MGDSDNTLDVLSHTVIVVTCDSEMQGLALGDDTIERDKGADSVKEGHVEKDFKDDGEILVEKNDDVLRRGVEEYDTLGDSVGVPLSDREPDNDVTAEGDTLRVGDADGDTLSDERSDSVNEPVTDAACVAL